MNNVEFIVRGKDTAFENFYVNGKKLKLKNGEKDTRTAVTIVGSGKLELVICKTHVYNGKLWWLWNILYYLFSGLGIFDIKKDKSCKVVDSRFLLQIESDTKVYVTELSEQEKFVAVDTIAQKQEIINVSYVDKEALGRQKRLKGYKALTFFSLLTVAIVSLVVVFVI